MDELKKDIKSKTEYFFETIKEIRRHIHKNPELSFKEYKTSEYICKILEKYHIEYEKNWANTGIVAKIKGKNKGKTIALRADIDALPIEEKNNIPYKSVNKGVMHACGHDVHTACQLGTIFILNELKEKISGKIYFIFQPGEEKIPGGASLLIKESLLEKINPSVIIALHVMPELEVGKVGFRKGIYMASADEIYITVKGKGGHAALPEKITDTVLISSNLIVTLQQIVSRKTPATIPSLLSFGKVIANGATNVIPDIVNIEGTFRTFDEKWRKKAHNLIKKISVNLCKSMGAKCDIEIKKGYPVLINDEKYCLKYISYCYDLLGKKNVVELPLRMGSEDFAFFSHLLPVVFFRLGTGNKKAKINAPLHSPFFNIDENALKTGVETLTWISLNELKN